MKENDNPKADRAVRFFQNLTQLEGRWAGQPLKLLPWERQIVRDVFGTTRPDGKRQYQTVYIEIPKKNGKTTLAAGFVLYLLTFDDEPAPQVYGAAVDRPQATLVFRPAANMVRQSGFLNRRCRVIDSQKRIICPANNGFYQVLSADVEQKHGLNIHGVVIDELHAQPNRRLVDVLTKYSGAAREQPLTVIITTAGTDRNSIGWEYHDKARQIINGTRNDPTFYAVIYGLEDDENWKDEALWHRVNPSLGHILKLEDFRKDFDDALQSPSDEASFRQLRLNQWVKQTARAINLETWDRNDAPMRPLFGRRCYGGLDLAAVEDLTAFAIASPAPDGFVDLAVHFWIPEDRMSEIERRHKVPYSLWSRQGYVTATPGGVIDPDFVIEEIAAICQELDVVEIAFDRWGSAYIISKLQELGFRVDEKARRKKLIQMGQGFGSMGAPTKEFKRLVGELKIRHARNPILRWNIDNFVVRRDPAGNEKPDKEKATEKIDGAVAAIMAIDRVIRNTNLSGKSIYDERGFESL